MCLLIVVANYECDGACSITAKKPLILSKVTLSVGTSVVFCTALCKVRHNPMFPVFCNATEKGSLNKRLGHHRAVGKDTFRFCQLLNTETILACHNFKPYMISAADYL